MGKDQDAKVDLLLEADSATARRVLPHLFAPETHTVTDQFVDITASQPHWLSVIDRLNTGAVVRRKRGRFKRSSIVRYQFLPRLVVSDKDRSDIFSELSLASASFSPFTLDWSRSWQPLLFAAFAILMAAGMILNFGKSLYLDIGIATVPLLLVLTFCLRSFRFRRQVFLPEIRLDKDDAPEAYKENTYARWQVISASDSGVSLLAPDTDLYIVTPLRSHAAIERAQTAWRSAMYGGWWPSSKCVIRAGSGAINASSILALRARFSWLDFAKVLGAFALILLGVGTLAIGLLWLGTNLLEGEEPYWMGFGVGLNMTLSAFALGLMLTLAFLGAWLYVALFLLGGFSNHAFLNFWKVHARQTGPSGWITIGHGMSRLEAHMRLRIISENIWSETPDTDVGHTPHIGMTYRRLLTADGDSG